MFRDLTLHGSPDGTFDVRNGSHFVATIIPMKDQVLVRTTGGSVHLQTLGQVLDTIRDFMADEELGDSEEGTNNDITGVLDDYHTVEVMLKSLKKDGVTTLGWSAADMVAHAEQIIAEGWDLEMKPTPLQIAACLLGEATSQDIDVACGNSHVNYPKALRRMAYCIQRKEEMDSLRQANDEARDQGLRK